MGTPVKDTVDSDLDSKGCQVQFNVERMSGNVVAKDVKICKVADDGSIDMDSCRQARKIAATGAWYISFGWKTPADAAGQYICIYTKDGTETTGGPVTLTVTDQTDYTVTITPLTETVECTEKKKGCTVDFQIERAAGKVVAKETKICKVADDGSLKSCKQGRWSSNRESWFIGMGQRTPLSSAGQYMCVYTKDGRETKGGPLTVVVNPA